MRGVARWSGGRQDDAQALVPAGFHFVILHSGPEEFVNLRGPLVQSSKWFGISSVQFSSLVTSLSGKFVQFSSGHGDQVPPFSSVQFRLGSVHRASNCLGGAEEKF